jgi:hypothetical protein
MARRSVPSETCLLICLLILLEDVMFENSILFEGRLLCSSVSGPQMSTVRRCHLVEKLRGDLPPCFHTEAASCHHGSFTKQCPWSPESASIPLSLKLQLCDAGAGWAAVRLVSAAQRCGHPTGVLTAGFLICYIFFGLEQMQVQELH